MTERWLTIDGYRYPFRVHPGPRCARPVFFLNGAFQTMDSWGRFMNHYRLSRTVILCDLPGTGQSDEVPATVGLDFFGRALRLVLDTVGVPRTHLFGASYGAPVAYRFAQMYPERVGSMALAGVARQLPDHVRARTAGTLEIVRAGRLAEFAREGVDILIGAEAAPQVVRGHVVRRVLENGLARLTSRQQRQYIAATTRLLTHPPLDLAAAPSARTLVLTGEHDIYTRPEDCREVADSLPHARFVTIPHAGHLFHLERPDVAIEVFSEFLAGVERSAPALAPGAGARKEENASAPNVN
jgi:pimeloyl-ACP methyl ester carboxylesterase